MEIEEQKEDDEEEQEEEEEDRKDKEGRRRERMLAFQSYERYVQPFKSAWMDRREEAECQ